MILNNRFEEPYNKFPGDGPIQLLSKPIVKSKLSKKFWLYSQYLESQNLINKEEEIFNDNNEEEYSNNYINNEQSIKIKYKRPKTANCKKTVNIKNNIKNNIGNKSIKKKNKNNIFKNDIDEINELNDIIYNLQCELNKQDFIINNQINEKMKLQKRIYELEQVLKNFC